MDTISISAITVMIMCIRVVMARTVAVFTVGVGWMESTLDSIDGKLIRPGISDGFTIHSCPKL
jgi:hypothetical protein